MKKSTKLSPEVLERAVRMVFYARYTEGPAEAGIERRWAVGATATTMRWPRRSMACTRSKSFTGTAPGRAFMPWSHHAQMNLLVQQSPIA